MSDVVIVAAALVRKATVLAQQRAFPAEVAGLWELPGGRVEPGESDADAARRECREELGVEIVARGRVGDDVPLPGGKVLRVFDAVLADPAAEPRAVEHRAVRWLAADELAEIDWLPADRVLVPALEELLARPTVEGPSRRRATVEPIDAGGHDTTSIISRHRR